MTDNITIRDTKADQPDVFVEPAWLAEHLNDPKVHVVEVDVSRAKYDQGHIPGAILGFAHDWNRKLE